MGERLLANLFGDNEIVSTNYPTNGASSIRFPFEPEPSHWVILYFINYVKYNVASDA
jgi:hypothetical protein